ncbi:MAG: hypothetical protein BMS9Abin24_149 [Thermodesulfobacteriota bacterium]|nr:MAG: hypothetical protein BMS9Abin24_149 [Thermodesulfobacteriota bacterium]
MSLKEYSRGGLLVLAGLMLVVFTGCGNEKKSAPAPETAGAPAGEASMPEGHPPAGDPLMNEMAQVSHANIKTQKEVSIAPEVKKKWTMAKLSITDASTKRTETLTVAVGKAVQLNDAGLKLRLDVIVPDYAIAEDRIESRSNEDKNPAVLIELLDADKVVARGWVFRDFPEFNSYTDLRFPVVLVETGTGK